MAVNVTHPQRPQAPAPNVAAIPAELQARAQWVTWRYEWRHDKWTKVPYIPATTRPASSTRPSTWRSFNAAWAAYRENPNGLDGIAYVFSAGDPYVGGDFDHCLENGVLSDFARQHLPATYAEISPSGKGVKFIVRATVAGGRKTKVAEVYGFKRYFTFTGAILPGQPATIAEGQAAIDALLAALPGGGGRGTSRQTLRDGTRGNGSRAAQVEQIPESEWEAGRQVLRTDIHRTLARVRAAGRGETQLAYLLREDYAGFHQKWPFVSIYRTMGASTTHRSAALLPAVSRAAASPSPSTSR
jgi:hypothetical protein